MNISDIADKLENEKIYPNIIYKKYHNENYGNVDIIYKYECDILFKLIKNKEFKFNDEYSPDEDYVSKYSYTYYYVDAGIYYSDKYLFSKYKDESTIPISIYYKNKLELPKELNDIQIKKPPKIEPIKINPNNDFIYSTFDKEGYNIIDDVLIQYKNFSKSEYDKIIQPFNQINYVVNNNSWVSTRKNTEFTLKMMNTFLLDGYIVPIILLYEDGKYRPIACNCKVITAKLFNMPYIPTIILFSNKKYNIVNYE